MCCYQGIRSVGPRGDVFYVLFRDFMFSKINQYFTSSWFTIKFGSTDRWAEFFLFVYGLSLDFWS